MKKLPLIILAATAINATAQDLTKEITVDKEIVPEERAATRLRGNASLISPNYTTPSISMSERAVVTKIPNMIERLEPVAAESGDTIIPWRGYAALAWGPYSDVAASAGYRLLDQDGTLLKAWFQFDRENYTRRNLLGNRYHYATQAWDLGLSYDQKLSNERRVDAAIVYSNLAVRHPWREEDKKLGAHRILLEANFSGKAACDYSVGVFAGYTAWNKDYLLELSNPVDDDYHKAQKQFNFGIQGSVGSSDDNGDPIGLDFKASFLHYNHYLAYEKKAYTNDGSDVKGVIRFNPHWRHDMQLSGDFSALVGLNADLVINEDRFLNLSPNARVSWVPQAAKGYFALDLTATGGVDTNPLSSLIDYTPYLMPNQAACFSRVPADLELTLTAGPWRGVALSVFGGYSWAQDWLVPTAFEQNGEYVYGVGMLPENVYGWRIGARLDSKYVTATYTHAPNDGQHGYYRFRDRATDVVSAQVNVEVYPRIDVTVGFEGRWGGYNLLRSTQIWDPVVPDGVKFAPTGETPYQGNGYEIDRVSLGRSVNLYVGASWRYNSQLSFFLRGENLLDSKNYTVLAIPSKGIHGLLGATYKF